LIWGNIKILVDQGTGPFSTYGALAGFRLVVIQKLLRRERIQSGTAVHTYPRWPLSVPIERQFIANGCAEASACQYEWSNFRA
jgi:hypothetical protein